MLFTWHWLVPPVCWTKDWEVPAVDKTGVLLETAFAIPSESFFLTFVSKLEFFVTSIRNCKMSPSDTFFWITSRSVSLVALMYYSESFFNSSSLVILTITAGVASSVFPGSLEFPWIIVWFGVVSGILKSSSIIDWSDSVTNLNAVSISTVIEYINCSKLLSTSSVSKKSPVGSLSFLARFR